MTADLAGKIFHFKPRKDHSNDGYPYSNPLDPYQTRKGGRRSNRLFALHPVVVLKGVKTEDIGEPILQETKKENIDVRTGGNNNNLEPARDGTPRRRGTSGIDTPNSVSAALHSPPPTPASTLKSSPASSSTSQLASKRELHSGVRRPSLERHDADANLIEPVMIVNITSQVHDAIDGRNYLPIAAPGREYKDDLEKRVFLTPEPSPESSPTTSADGNYPWDSLSEASYGTELTDFSSWSDDMLTPASGALEKPSFLSNNPDVHPLNVPQYLPPDDGFEKSSDEIWGDQIAEIDDLTPEDAAMPRKDSFIRLDSRTTVSAEALQPFLRPSGNQYELQPKSRDLLWQAVVECEREYKDPKAAVLDEIQSTTETQVEEVVKEQATKEIKAIELVASERLKHHIKQPRDHYHVDRILESVSDDMLRLMREFRQRELRWLRETYRSLHCEMILAPIEKDKPFHPEQYLGKMIKHNRDEMDRGRGEGKASLNKPIKSTLALKAIAEGKPLPDKREEAMAHRKAVAFRPCRANSNPEDVRPYNAVPIAAQHPLASKHSKSSGAIAAQSQRPKSTFHNEAPAKPRIQDKNWVEAGNWRGSPTSEPKRPDLKRMRSSEVIENKTVGDVQTATPVKNTPPMTNVKLTEPSQTQIKAEPKPMLNNGLVANIPPVKSAKITTHDEPDNRFIGSHPATGGKPSKIAAHNPTGHSKQRYHLVPRSASPGFRRFKPEQHPRGPVPLKPIDHAGDDYDKPMFTPPLFWNQEPHHFRIRKDSGFENNDIDITKSYSSSPEPIRSFIREDSEKDDMSRYTHDGPIT